MKIDILTNFDFRKLRDKWTSSIKPKIMENIPKEAASRWKKNILDKHFTPLEDSTIELRKGGGKKPLFDTGNLYRSIVAQKKSVKHLAYGEHHIDGYTTSTSSMIPGKTVPPRRWKDKRFAILTEKTKKRSMKEIRTGLRRAGRGKIISKY